jgi:hypothetical protein
VAANFEYNHENLTKWDGLSACWVQLPIHRVQELQTSKCIPEGYTGYEDTANDNKTMYEFHVDDIKDSRLLPELEDVLFGGLLSVQKDERFPEYIGRQVLGWGHDEVVADEKSHNAMTWLGPDGQQFLQPKDLGAAIHLSAFGKRQVGWHPQPTESQLGEINRSREGKKYLASEQAKRLYGDNPKRPLAADQCSSYWDMEPGANRDRYWTLANVAVQFENLCDVCAVMYPNERFLHVASLDNSTSHGGKREGSLDVNQMDMGFGGKQLVPEDVILGSEGCFGKHKGSKALPLGSKESFIFKDDDEGPSWLTPAQRLDGKYDKTLPEVKTRALKKTELVASLKAAMDVVSDGLNDKQSMAWLKALTGRHDMATHVKECKVKEGSTPL